MYLYFLYSTNGICVLVKEESKNHIRKTKNERKIECNFEENLNVLKKELISLLQRNHLAKDVKFLRKMAINIKHLHYEAKNSGSSKKHAKEVAHFLSTPIGAPFITKRTLTQAADTFGEQDPKESDLSQLLCDFAKYGKHYPTQLLKALL